MVMKKPAAGPPEEEEEQPPEEEVHAEQEDLEEAAKEEPNEEEALAKREEELYSARKKELKALSATDVRELAQKLGVDASRKDDMIVAIADHEAKARADERAKQAEIRDVVVTKKQELEAMNVLVLKELCDGAGVKGTMSKQARVELLMKRWQEGGGVDAALAQRVRAAREKLLQAMDTASLRSLCEASGVQPFVKEVMVERAVRQEAAKGRFARPQLVELDVEEEAPKQPTDMVDALLANEASRKRAKELKEQEEAAAVEKKKELRAMSMDELKQQLSQKGGEEPGKCRKEDLVELVVAAIQREEAAAARKAKLKALGVEELRQRVLSRGLKSSARAMDMVEALLQHEADAQERCKVFSKKLGEALACKRAELEALTASELKDVCAATGLKHGVGKQDRLETLLEHARSSGELDKRVEAETRKARAGELLALGDAEVLAVCEQAGGEPVVREIAIERLLAYEEEHGPADLETRRPAKRAKKAGD
eukprot:CAMPEP_0171103564 /NCGR_PEP_ID=MMETSP0766_2-20121228/58984_1 /TAXON_ID=439317 /ORGANISM="Gambierdiscus australes, Strain CAWD 149" /LENGTH=484 /DNA_ID=CAMNT_0011563999 /DNA_START=49 /DNA_END=1503 /DNA_ORIENTATION=+